MDDNADYYGKPTNTNIQTLGQRLREYYSPEDFVTVQNVDTLPITYQFTSPTDRETFSDYPGHKETIMKRPPQRVTLQPGETKLCPAYEADLMIENLIKQMTSKSTANKIATGDAVAWQSTNWSDPIVQEKLIGQIFLGKKDILGEYNSDLDKPNTDVEKDLLDEPTEPTPEPARRGRPPKAIEAT